MSLTSIAEFIEAAAAALAALRLLQLGLFRSQTGLFFYTVTLSVALSLMAVYPGGSTGYLRIFVCSTLLICLASAFAVWQIFTLALADYAGIRTAARVAMYVALAAGCAISLAVGWPAWQRSGPGGHSVLLYTVEFVNRSVLLILTVFIAVYLGLISRYPLELHRNTFVSCGFFGAIFLLEGLSTLADTLSPHLYFLPIDIAHILLSAGCLVAWTLMLRPELVPRKVKFQHPNEAQLLRELDALNVLLSRAGRK